MHATPTPQRPCVDSVPPYHIRCRFQLEPFEKLPIDRSLFRDGRFRISSGPERTAGIVPSVVLRFDPANVPTNRLNAFAHSIPHSFFFRHDTNTHPHLPSY